MSNSLLELESLPTNTDSSLYNMTYHNIYSPKNNQTVNLFQATKKSQRNQNVQKKKNQIFETHNKIEIPKNKNENSQINIPKITRSKDNYIDLLISSFDKMIEKGEITLNYLNSPILNLNYENIENNFSKKCENKICAIVVYDENLIYHTKFVSNNSYKPQSIWLCEKCYNAFKSGNYCYYCNIIIYRDFEFNTQYYDKKKWIQCDYCQRWQHIQCEEKKGKYNNVEELAMNPNFKYMCPFCRKEHYKFIRDFNKNSKKKDYNKKNLDEFSFVKKKRKKIKKKLI